MHIAFDHVGVAVASMVRASEFYQDILGVAVTKSVAVPSHGITAHCLNLDGVVLELLEPTAATSPVSRFLSRRGPGLHHMCLRVDDLSATIAMLRRKEIRLVSEQPEIGLDGTQVIFVHPSSADGVLVELKQRSSPAARSAES